MTFPSRKDDLEMDGTLSPNLPPGSVFQVHAGSRLLMECTCSLPGAATALAASFEVCQSPLSGEHQECQKQAGHTRGTRRATAKHGRYCGDASRQYRSFSDLQCAPSSTLCLWLAGTLVLVNDQSLWIRPGAFAAWDMPGLPRQQTHVEAFIKPLSKIHATACPRMRPPA